jgi:transmembrane protein
MDIPRRLLAALIALPFVVSGIGKLIDFGGTQAELLALSGLQPTALWAAAVIVTQLGGSALLIFARGRWALLGASTLAAFTVLATVLAHDWWRKQGLDRMRDFNVFWEHAALVGGLLLAGWVNAREPAHR